MIKIACIGSRTVPEAVRRCLWNLGRLFASLGWHVVTGNCKGADQQFAAGAGSVDPALVELVLPWKGYEQEAIRPGNRVRVAWQQRYHEIASRSYGRWRPINPPQGGGLAQARRMCREIGVDPELLRPSGRELLRGPEYLGPPDMRFGDLKHGTRRLMARNAAILDGARLVVAYPNLGSPTGGGTGVGMKLATESGIPVVDLARGRGLSILCRIARRLPWPDQQDLVLETFWLHRAGGRWPKDVYEDRMSSGLMVMLWHLARLSPEERRTAMSRLSRSLLWEMVENAELLRVRKAPTRTRWILKIQDPIGVRVFLPRTVDVPRPEREPEGPEADLRRVFRPYDTGNPWHDRAVASRQLHPGDQLLLRDRDVLYMSSGMVLRKEPSSRTDRARDADFDRIARVCFQAAGLWDLTGADLTRVLTLRDRLRSSGMSRKDIAAVARDAIERTFARAGDHRAASLREAARDVLDDLSSLLQAARDVEAQQPLLPASWQRLKGRRNLESHYPTAHPAFIDLAASLASREADGGDGDDGGHRDSGFDRVILGHLWNAMPTWEERMEARTHPKPHPVIDLYRRIREARSRKELFDLEVRTWEFRGVNRQVLETAVVIATKRLEYDSRRKVARASAGIRSSASIRYLERLRGRIRHPRPHIVDYLDGLVEGRIATLRRLRRGELTAPEISRARRTDRFSDGEWYAHFGKRLGGKPTTALLDRLVQNARQVWSNREVVGAMTEEPAAVLETAVTD